MDEAKPYESHLSRLAVEAKEDYWANYLDGIDDPHVRLCTSLMLENQRLWEEHSHNQNHLGDEVYELIAHAFPQLLIHKIASVQPLLGPVGIVYYKRLRIRTDVPHLEAKWEYESEDIAVRTMRLPVVIRGELEVNEIAHKLMARYDQEIINDLWNTANTVASREKLDDQVLFEIGNVMDRKTLLPGRKWLVVGRGTYEANKDLLDGLDRNNYTVHVNNHMNQPGVLMGLEVGTFDRQCIHAPYIFLTKAPTVTDPDTCMPRNYLLARYGKKLTRSGAKWFARIALTGGAK